MPKRPSAEDGVGDEADQPGLGRVGRARRRPAGAHARLQQEPAEGDGDEGRRSRPAGSAAPPSSPRRRSARSRCRRRCRSGSARPSRASARGRRARRRRCSSWKSWPSRRCQNQRPTSAQFGAGWPGSRARIRLCQRSIRRVAPRPRIAPWMRSSIGETCGGGRGDVLQGPRRSRRRGPGAGAEPPRGLRRERLSRHEAGDGHAADGTAPAAALARAGAGGARAGGAGGRAGAARSAG